LFAALPETCVVVFDLDDTLYSERAFVLSGFRAVATYIEQECAAHVFEALCQSWDAGDRDPFGRVAAEFALPIPKSQLIEVHRTHVPELALAADVKELLSSLRAAGHSIGIMTDGRSNTQRNKMRALGLDAWTDEILISEEFGSSKPAERNYRYFEQRFPRRRFAFVGNDPNKDFVTANRLGWQTICVLDPGDHIHPQSFERVPIEAHPQYLIERLA
jgi:putative hydrolase of the HAD superfamily